MPLKMSGNKLVGKVQKIEEGPISAKVTIQTKGGHDVIAKIMMSSIQSLGLKVGMEAYAVFKGAAVLIAASGTKISGNKIPGKISKIDEGAANATVVVDVGGGQTVSSIIMMGSLKEMGLKTGTDVLAVIKPASVFVAVA